MRTASISNQAATSESERSGRDEITVLNILLRDALALRQRLFSYLQFYLTAQAGLAALFAIVAHDSYDVVIMPSAQAVLLLSTLGLLSSFLVIAYGLFVLRPGSNSREWVSNQLEQTSSFGDAVSWSDACGRRLAWLISANSALDIRVTRIRIGILLQLVCGFAVFLLSMRL